MDETETTVKWRKDRQQWNGGNEDNSEMEETETTVNWRKPKPWNGRKRDNREMEERETTVERRKQRTVKWRKAIQQWNGLVQGQRHEQRCMREAL